MSPGRFTQRGLNVYGSCSGARGNVFAMGNYCYVASAGLSGMRHLGTHRGGEGLGQWGILCLHAHSLFQIILDVRKVRYRPSIQLKSLSLIDSDIYITYTL